MKLTFWLGLQYIFYETETILWDVDFSCQALKEVASFVLVKSVPSFECHFELQNPAVTCGDMLHSFLQRLSCPQHIGYIAPLCLYRKCY